MKLSARTLQILDNYSKVNSDLLIHKDSDELHSITVMRNVYSIASIDEKFENEVRLPNIKEFIKFYKQFNELDITKIDSDFIHLKNEDVEVKYPMGDKNLMCVPTRSVEMPTDEIYKIKLSKTILNCLMKIGQNYITDVSIEANGQTLTLKLFDKKNPKDLGLIFNLGKTKDEYNALFKLLNLRLLYPTDYEVTISSKYLSEFKSDDENITTYIALEPDSKFPIQ